MKPKLNLLISAYACEPDEGSEPGVGWNWVSELSKYHNIWVITRRNNQVSIEKACNKNLDNITWLYYDLPNFLSFWKKGQRGVRLYYYLWQLGSFLWYRSYIEKENIDIIHHLTFGMYWMPSFFHFTGKPFVWGPIGGCEDAPYNFIKQFSYRGRMYEFARKMARSILELDPFVRLTIKRASLILCKANETKEKIENLGGNEVLLFPESALTIDELNYLENPRKKSKGEFTLISIGRLLNWKGFDLSIKAFAKFNEKFPKSQYLIVGEGPEKDNYKQLVKRFGIEDRVVFTGFISRNEVLALLKKSDLFVHPSLHDSGGWVCLEAMAAGKPVICMDLGGPALQVTDEIGFKIAAETPEQAVDELASKFLLLAKDSELCNKKGNLARQRVNQYFTWENKIQAINSLYKKITNPNGKINFEKTLY